MADIADQAQQQAAPLHTTDHRRPEGPAPTGYCLNCETPLALPLRWCDWDCQQDWRHRNARTGGKS